MSVSPAPRRRAPRLPVELSARLRGRTPRPARVLDLSVSGCLVRAERASGLMSGVVEVSFQGAGNRTSRVVLRARQAIPSASDGVRSGETVQVLFRRGSVRIEMEGRVLSAAAPGQAVTVWVAESRRSFAGTVAGRKVVDVVLP